MLESNLQPGVNAWNNINTTAIYVRTTDLPVKFGESGNRGNFFQKSGKETVSGSENLPFLFRKSGNQGYFIRLTEIRILLLRIREAIPFSIFRETWNEEKFEGIRVWH